MRLSDKIKNVLGLRGFSVLCTQPCCNAQDVNAM